MQKVILLKDLPGWGFKGEIIKTKPKYATNHLFKSHLAIEFFPGRREILFPEFN